MIVYMILNHATEMFYIGKTVHPLKERMKDHFKDANTSRKNSRFHKDIREYGTEVFEGIILQNCSDQKEMDNYESIWISYLNSSDHNVGYNTIRPNLLCERPMKKEKQIYTRESYVEWGKKGGRKKSNYSEPD